MNDRILAVTTEGLVERTCMTMPRFAYYYETMRPLCASVLMKHRCSRICYNGIGLLGNRGGCMQSHKFRFTPPGVSTHTTVPMYARVHALENTDTQSDAYDSNSDGDEYQADGDTIVAIVTGGQQGAVSIVRVSGDEAVETIGRIFVAAGSKKKWKPESHRVYYGHVVDNGAIIDEVLVIVMLGPRSYTAEDVVEIHTHGGGICAQRVLQCCLEQGARLSSPGEFTLRAYLNGRLDLSQAESVASLVSARTAAAADCALAGLSGGLGDEITDIRNECLSLVSEIDAHIDFDDDLPPLDCDGVSERVGLVLDRVERALSTAKQGRLLSSGIQVVLVGQPNVGKSSLLNALSGYEKAIVTDVAGTTRDIVEADVVIGGIPVTLLDTAGLRDTKDKVEMIGVERTRAASQAADVLLHVVDASRGWTAEDEAILKGVVGDDGQAFVPPMMLLVNKVDLVEEDRVDALIPEDVRKYFSRTVSTSASTGSGMASLHDGLLELVGAPTMSPGGISWAVNDRQAEALTRAYESLVQVQDSIESQLPLDFWTIDLRSALLSLGEICGAEVTEEVLDDVFSRFCIGK